MNREWWEPILHWTLWGIAMTVVMGWIARSRTKLRPQGEQSMLKHPSSTLVLGLVCAVFFFALFVISNTIGRNDSVTVWTDLIFLGFTAMGLYVVGEYVVVRHRLTPEGIHYTPLLRRRGFIAWNEISIVDYAPVMKWFRLRTPAGVTVRISAMLLGLPEFARQVLAHIPADRFDVQTAALLRETAAGNLPRV